MHAIDQRLEKFRAGARDRKRRQRAIEESAHEGEGLELFDDTENWGWIERRLAVEDQRRLRSRGNW